MYASIFILYIYSHTDRYIETYIHVYRDKGSRLYLLHLGALIRRGVFKKNLPKNLMDKSKTFEVA